MRNDDVGLAASLIVDFSAPSWRHLAVGAKISFVKLPSVP